MSDDEEEYEYDYGSDQDQEGDDMGGEDQGDEDEEAIEIENSFYEGEEKMSDAPSGAIEMFMKVVELETSRQGQGKEVKWRFKALQHLVTINFTIQNFDAMIANYKRMLEDMAIVTRNQCTEAINVILETLSASTNSAVLVQMFEITLTALKTANNERLWFNTNLKLAKLYLDTNNIGEADRLMTDLKTSCQHPDGSDDMSKGTNLLEVYCLEIQLCAKTNNTARMRQVYPRTTNLSAAVADPRIMGVIREEGGKMHMAESSWDEAYNELYEAFRNYQEAGNTSRAKDCLKYVVLASMLALTSINPFSAREAKVFADDKEIIAMSDLRQSLESNDLARFERIIKDKRNHILDEPILMAYIEPLRRRMREQVLLNITRPYQKVTLAFLARELNIPEVEVEALMVDMILDDRLSAQIDQIQGFVFLGGNRESVAEKKMKSMAKWASTLQSINEGLSSNHT